METEVFSVDCDDQFKEENGEVSKMILSSSVGDGGGVLIKVVVVVSAVVPTIIVVGVRVVELGSVALSFVISVLPAPWFSWFLCPSASFGGCVGLSGITVLLLLPWLHKEECRGIG